MRKILALVLAITTVFALAVPAMAVSPKVEVLGFAFHCNAKGGNGKAYIVGRPQDFGKKEIVVLTRNEKDPKVWDVVVPDGEVWVCATCGGRAWMSFSNKSGVPDGKNIQLFHPAKEPLTPDQLEYLRYRAYVKLWNDFYHGPSDLRLPGDEADSDIRLVLYNCGGMAHYTALLAFYGADSLPPYFYFGDYRAAEQTWVAWLEQGLIQAAIECENLSQVTDRDSAMTYLNSVVVAYGDIAPEGFFD